MHITEVPERTTIQFDRTVANLLAQPGKGHLQLVFDIDALEGRHYVNVGNGITLERESVPGEIHKDRQKEREADEIVRRIQRRLLGFLARWRLWKAPVSFEKPAIHSQKGATVKVFEIVVHEGEEFVETYLKLMDAIRQTGHYAGMSFADPFVTQSRTKARNTAARRAASTDFTLSPETTADPAVPAATPESLALESAGSPAGETSTGEERTRQDQEFSLDWD
jgi:hypothetical protein